MLPAHTFQGLHCTFTYKALGENEEGLIDWVVTFWQGQRRRSKRIITGVIKQNPRGKFHPEFRPSRPELEPPVCSTMTEAIHWLANIAFPGK